MATDPARGPFVAGDRVEYAESDGYIFGTVIEVLDNEYVMVTWDDIAIHSDQLIPEESR